MPAGSRLGWVPGVIKLACKYSEEMTQWGEVNGARYVRVFLWLALLVEW
jgi:hypothetical protein